MTVVRVAARPQDRMTNTRHRPRAAMPATPATWCITCGGLGLTYLVGWVESTSGWVWRREPDACPTCNGTGSVA